MNPHLRTHFSTLVAVLFATLVSSGCLKETASVLFDSTRVPTGTVALAASKYTNTSSVTLNVTTTNATEMAIFIDRTCGYFNAPEWEPVTATKAITLPPAEGPHQVAILFRNEGHYQSECQTLDVVYDVTPPTAPGSLAVRTRTTNLTASALFGFASSTDLYSPIEKYQARAVTTGGTSLSAWTDITDLTTVSSQTHYLTGLSLVDGTSYAVEVRALDAAGNLSATARSSNFEAGPTLTVANKYLYAPSGTFAVAITLSRAITSALTLRVQTEPIDAIPGVDYLPADYTLTVNAGATSVNATLMPLDSVLIGVNRKYKLKAAESPSAVHFASNTFETFGVAINGAAVDSTGASFVAVGPHSSCFVKDATDIRCLGQQTNNGSQYWTETVPASTGVQISDPSGIAVTKMTSGGQTCALDQNQGLVCWGWNGGFAVGDGSIGTTPYLPIYPFYDVIDVSSSGYGTCIIHDGGVVECWGKNTNGRFGTGTTTTSAANVHPTGYGPSDTPPALPTKIALGVGHMCLLLDDGNVKCVGSNENGSLGNGNAGVTQSLSFVNVTLPATADDLIAGPYSVCAHLTDGRYACWGDVIHSTIGLTDGLAAQVIPTVVPNFQNAKRIALGSYHGCIVNATDDLYCWGYNMMGSLANPIIKYSVNFSRASLFTEKARDVSVSEYTTCATSTGGGAYCWGAGDDTTGDYQRGNYTAFQTQGGHQSLKSDVVSLRMGFGLGCVIKTDKTAWCWGTNVLATANDATDSFYSLQAKQIYSGTVIDVSSGSNHVCVIAEADKNVYCKGKNTYGQLGDGTTTDSDVVFKRVLTLSNVKQISAGPEYTCAVTELGSVSCWGRGPNGQLGSTVAGNFTSTPISVSSLPSMSSVRVGRLHACGIAGTTGFVYCWGDNSYGQIGNGTTGGVTAPTQVSSVSSAVRLAVGGAYTYVNTAAGSGRCWGSNAYGQLGVGNNKINFPTPFSCGLSGSAVAIAASEYVSCLINSGFVQCAGNNTAGAAAVGNAAEYLSPTYSPNTEISGSEIGLSTISDGTTGIAVFGCVLAKYPGSTSGRVNCWGSSGYGIGALTKGRETPKRIKFD